MAETTKVWTHGDVQAWFATRLPDGWFIADPEVTLDREEILVIGRLDGAPTSVADAATPEARPGSTQADEQVACSNLIREFREASRDERMRIADEAEILWERKVSWGVECGGYQIVFTTQSIPVMTRLRMDERNVLDTLISAGVARSRSEALAWCVRLVGRHQADWIDQLREAMAQVDRVRADGPG